MSKQAKAMAVLVLQNAALRDELYAARKRADWHKEAGDGLSAELQNDRAELKAAGINYSRAMAERQSLYEQRDRLQEELNVERLHVADVRSALADVGLDTYSTTREAIEASAAMTEENQEAYERVKGQLEAMQRDRDALAAELRAGREGNQAVSLHPTARALLEVLRAEYAGDPDKDPALRWLALGHKLYPWFEAGFPGASGAMPSLFVAQRVMVQERRDLMDAKALSFLRGRRARDAGCDAMPSDLAPELQNAWKRGHDGSWGGTVSTHASLVGYEELLRREGLRDGRCDGGGL